MNLLKFGLTPALVFFLLQGWSLPEAEDDSLRPTPTPTTTTPTATPRFETAETEAKSRHLRLTLTDPFFMFVVLVVFFCCCCCWRKDWKVKGVPRCWVRLLSFDSPSKINFRKNRNSLDFERHMKCLRGIDKACFAGSLGSIPAPSNFFFFLGYEVVKKSHFYENLSF